MNRPLLPAKIVDTRVVAIARRLPLERLVDLADVLCEAGVAVIEVTVDSPDAYTAIERLAEGPALVGAGTVMSADDVVRARDAGAEFIVSPHTDPGVVEAARERELAVMAGALTPTEAVAAWDLGVSAVKLFPASLGGPAYLAGLAAPLPHIPFVPTGGVEAANAGRYFAAGAIAIGVGKWLTGSTDLEMVRTRALGLVEVSRLPG